MCQSQVESDGLLGSSSLRLAKKVHFQLLCWSTKHINFTIMGLKCVICLRFLLFHIFNTLVKFEHHNYLFSFRKTSSWFNEWISFSNFCFSLIIVWWEWRLYVFMEVCQAIFLSMNSSGCSAIPLFLYVRLTTGYMEECYWCSIIAVGAVSEGAGCLTQCLWFLLSWPNTHHIVILWFMFPLFFPDSFTESQIIALWLCQFLMIDVLKLYGLISNKTGKYELVPNTFWKLIQKTRLLRKAASFQLILSAHKL